ncbi:hypothetical protein [Cupriavidus necator]|uniref:hypothetical protein n=1 Tax=Cupriavidus necator TaxID=106590 RepID=UPI0005A20798|nr:hypothetical protein [Cupriavidus necator]QQB81333.1 hypothetical protein I6H87_33610 [Cupriavidus necator]
MEVLQIGEIGDCASAVRAGQALALTTDGEINYLAFDLAGQLAQLLRGFGGTGRPLKRWATNINVDNEVHDLTSRGNPAGSNFSLDLLHAKLDGSSHKPLLFLT